MKLALNVSLFAGAVALMIGNAALAGPSTLQARDIDHDGVADAYYDASSNLTWWADANAVVTTGYTYPLPQGAPADWFQDSNGGVNDDAASGWLQTLDSKGITGWRLPTVQVTQVCDNLPHTTCWGEAVAGTSELEELITRTLGNTAGTVSNSGPFTHILGSSYWTSATVYMGPGKGMGGIFFDPVLQTYTTGVLAGNPHEQIWAVHTGDIGTALSAPEPSTATLTLMGGLVSAAIARRSSKKRSG